MSKFVIDLSWDNLDKAMKDLELEAAHVIRGLTVEAFNSILSKTPQFYGRMAASWTYSVGKPEFVDRSHLVQDPTEGKQSSRAYDDFGNFRGLWRGHPAAIAIAKSASAGRDGRYRLGSTIYISNGVDHGEGPYSQMIENGEIRLRMVNRPGMPASRTVDQMVSRYGGQRGVTAYKGAVLKALRIGG